MDLINHIVDKDLLVRRLDLTVNHVVKEANANRHPTPPQLYLFTDYE